jgi:hypothetical protein
MKVTERLTVELSTADVLGILEERVREVMRERGFKLVASPVQAPQPPMTFKGAPLRPRVGDES